MMAVAGATDRPWLLRGEGRLVCSTCAHDSNPPVVLYFNEAVVRAHSQAGIFQEGQIGFFF